MKTKNDATMKRKHRKKTAQSNVVSLNLNMDHELMARHQVRGPVSCQLDNLVCVFDANAMCN